jgi:hypothetical protein
MDNVVKNIILYFTLFVFASYLITMYIVFPLVSAHPLDYSYTTERKFIVYDNDKPVEITGRCESNSEQAPGRGVYKLVVTCKKENGELETHEFTRQDKEPNYEEVKIKDNPGVEQPSWIEQKYGHDGAEKIKRIHHRFDMFQIAQDCLESLATKTRENAEKEKRK